MTPPAPAERAFAARVLAAPRSTVLGWVIVIDGLCIVAAAATGFATGFVAVALVTVVALAWCYGWFAAGIAGTAVVFAINISRYLHPGGPDWTGEVANALALIGTVAMVAYVVDYVRHAYRHERHSARHDPLTGLLNRRSFFAHLDMIAGRADRDGDVRLMIYLDLDEFKNINDAHGHAAGDEVLCACAAALTTALPPDSCIARLGGDEFGALIRSSGVDPYSQAERLHRCVSDSLAALGFGPLGCSMGVVMIVPPTHATHEALVAWADALMYEVKRGGKGALRIGHATALAA